ncbi:unnamed protein product [Pylaiella littoralis]
MYHQGGGILCGIRGYAVSKSRFGFADEGRDRGPLLARKNLTHVPQKEGGGNSSCVDLPPV